MTMIGNRLLRLLRQLMRCCV